MVNPPQVHLGGVRVGDGLVLTLYTFLLMTLRIFFVGGRVATTLHFTAQVREDLALGPCDELLVDSPLRVWAEIRTAGMGDSPSMLGMGAMKLSKACNQMYEHEYVRKLDG
jgi:hypothetical protein